MQLQPRWSACPALSALRYTKPREASIMQYVHVSRPVGTRANATSPTRRAVCGYERLRRIPEPPRDVGMSMPPPRPFAGSGESAPGSACTLSRSTFCMVVLLACWRT